MIYYISKRVRRQARQQPSAPSGDKAGNDGMTSTTGETPMITQDRRVKRTQQLLARALIALTLEKGYESVTIRDLTERADVGYATFFRHYHDKDELLQDVLDVVLEELTTLLSPAGPGADPKAVGVVLFRYVQEQSEVVRVLLD